MGNPLLEDFKIALKVRKIGSITDYAETLQNPDGVKVSRTNIYHAFHHGSPEWLARKINSILSEERAKRPELYESTHLIPVSEPKPQTSNE